MKIVDIQPYDNFDVKFRLVICKTQREMINAYNKERPKENVSNASGIFSVTNYFTRTEKNMPGRFESNIFGTMWLNRETLSDKVIIHECGHAAFAFERNIMRYKGNFNDECGIGFCAYGDEEEVFCYFLENAYEKVKRAIKQHG